MDDTYFWSKHGRPSAEKDRVRNSVAELCLSHLKKEAAVMKTIHVESEENLKFKAQEDIDMSPFIMYSLNKKRRWEAEDAIGLELLDRAQKLNDGWKVLLIERVNLRSWYWPNWSYGSNPERFSEYFRIKDVHELSKDDAYKHKTIDSVFGQRFSHFMEANRKPVKEEEEVSEGSSEPLAAYNFLRAPKNFVSILQKEYKASNHGWEWPHVGYWRRVDQLKDNLLDLRYGEIENLDGKDVDEHDDVEPSEDVERSEPSKFYNLEEHLVDKFVVVKRRRRKNTC
ncbi:uncharacterized protein CELE_F17C11.11 [Caenorhabditis elegans]|uniref:Uncharacterized protein n=2 Tax=Caenorhabditis elegans TaxID=6239 RepID=Q9BI97_CAEEL|nr:Uncharacterized protein CELE_F17C11.11 [Caenorhabditis elegans]CAC35886.1 Uncharacterized protein CELE_F17C11.11 [Caenorhabditis elegans]|eukprot:NP_001256278.1 Uncharacterized protein CELE_F17C11.11 [Caenorhabditis elegans]